MTVKETSQHTLTSRSSAYACFILSVLLSFITANGQSAPPPPPTDLSEDISVYTSVMDPKVVSDIFGKRVAQRFVAIQVTVSNKNPNYQFLIHDVSLDLKNVFGSDFYTNIQRECDTCRQTCRDYPNPITETGQEGDEKRAQRKASCEKECAGTCRTHRFELSSLELSLIRGVAEKGQGEDTRNKVLRYFRAVGTIAAGLIGVASFGPSYPKSVAVFNGPVITSYSELYPDYTINQMNRLSDSAYKSNALVPKEQAKVLVAFIPQAIFLTKEQRQAFWEEPTMLYCNYGTRSKTADNRTTSAGTATGTAPCTTTAAALGIVDFRKAIARVDGSFIVEVKNLPPLITGVTIDPDEARKFLNARPVVKGTIVGRFLNDSKVDLTDPPEGMDIALNGAPSESRLDFIITSDRPVDLGTNLKFHVFKAQGEDTFSKRVSFTVLVPTAGEPTPGEANAGASDVEVTLPGTNFIEGVSTVVVVPPADTGVHVVPDSVKVESSTLIKFKLNIDTTATPGLLRLKVLNGTTESNRFNFTVNIPVPTLDDPAVPNKGPKGATALEVTLTGSKFLKDVTRVVPQAGSGVHVVPDSETVESPTSMKVKLSIDPTASSGVIKLGVSNRTQQSNKINFTVEAP